MLLVMMRVWFSIIVDLVFGGDCMSPPFFLYIYQW